MILPQLVQLVMVTLSLAADSAQPREYDPLEYFDTPTHLIESLSINGHTIEKWGPENGGWGQLIRIMTADGRLIEFGDAQLGGYGAHDPLPTADALQDLTGNGVPDLLIITWAGGMHCCLGLHLFELGEELKTLLEIPSWRGLFPEHTVEDLDGDGSMEIITYHGYYRYNFGCYGVNSTMPTIIFNFQEGLGYTIRTPDYIQLDVEQETKDLAAFLEEGEPFEFVSDVTCAVMNVVIPLLYSGQWDAAWHIFDRYYPEISDGSDEDREQLRSWLLSYLAEDPFAPPAQRDAD